jgi:hypothetical protein
VNPGQIERLLSGVPATVDERQRNRITAYAATARRCDERIAVRHTELARALRNLEAPAAAGKAAEPADEAIRLALELDALERIQPRIDSWLRVAVAAVADNEGLAPFGEGPA